LDQIFGGVASGSNLNDAAASIVSTTLSILGLSRRRLHLDENENDNGNDIDLSSEFVTINSHELTDRELHDRQLVPNPLHDHRDLEVKQSVETIIEGVTSQINITCDVLPTSCDSFDILNVPTEDLVGIQCIKINLEGIVEPRNQGYSNSANDQINFAVLKGKYSKDAGFPVVFSHQNWPTTPLVPTPVPIDSKIDTTVRAIVPIDATDLDIATKFIKATTTVISPFPIQPTVTTITIPVINTLVSMISPGTKEVEVKIQVTTSTPADIHYTAGVPRTINAAVRAGTYDTLTNYDVFLEGSNNAPTVSIAPFIAFAGLAPSPPPVSPRLPVPQPTPEPVPEETTVIIVTSSPTSSPSIADEEMVATESIQLYIVIARTPDDSDEEEVVAIKTKMEEGSPSTTAGGVLVIDDCSVALGPYLQQAEARAIEIDATAMMCASATIAVPETAVPATMESIQSGTFANNLGFLIVVLQDDVEYDEPSPSPSASTSTSTPTKSPSESPVVAITGSPTETPVVESSESPTETPVVEPTKSPSESPVVQITGSPTEIPVVEPTKLPTELPTDEVLEETGTPTTNQPTDTPTATPPITDESSPIDETDSSVVETVEVTTGGSELP